MKPVYFASFVSDTGVFSSSRYLSVNNTIRNFVHSRYEQNFILSPSSTEISDQTRRLFSPSLTLSEIHSRYPDIPFKDEWYRINFFTWRASLLLDILKLSSFNLSPYLFSEAIISLQASKIKAFKQ